MGQYDVLDKGAGRVGIQQNSILMISLQRLRDSKYNAQAHFTFKGHLLGAILDELAPTCFSWRRYELVHNCSLCATCIF